MPIPYPPLSSNTPVQRKILFVDDEESICDLFCRIMDQEPLVIETAANGREALEMLRTFPADIVITDMNMPVMDGMELLKELKLRHPDIFTIVITGYGSVEDAVTAIKAGAYDYILKPFDFAAITLLIKKIAAHKEILERHSTDKEDRRRDFRFENIIGQHPSMYEIFQKIEDVAGSDATVLITGETGTGKDLIAKEIHYRGHRKTGQFLDLNCGAISESLVHSELFGHEKGAFTGAVSLKKGYFEMADKGTLFLDEIGDVPLSVQVALLRCLEQGTFQRVGGTRTLHADVRIVCATNRPLAELVTKNRFREDLFYRINVVPIHIPPLRGRKTDIPLLANHFLQKYSKKNRKQDLKISHAAMENLVLYRWPGNIRELTNVIENAVIFCKGKEILPDHLPQALRASIRQTDFDLKLSSRSLSHAEEILIRNVLRETDWNLKQAATSLGIARGTLYSKIKKYGLQKAE